MKSEYKVMKYDSRNTCFCVTEKITLRKARLIAKKMSFTDFPKANVESMDWNTGFFEQYESGEMTSMSTTGHEHLITR